MFADNIAIVVNVNKDTEHANTLANELQDCGIVQPPSKYAAFSGVPKKSLGNSKFIVTE